VPDARDGWRQLQRRFRDDPDLRVDHVELFHARYAQADRDHIEQDVLRRFGKASGPTDRSGRVLVATQVIGNSLDVDFSDLVSDLAPVDLIIQRIGRAFRHSRSTSGARIDGPDQRGTPQVGLLSPPLPEDPGADWYAEMFPRAAYVYPDVARLWLTAAALEDAGQIDVPGDPTTPGGVRNIIERVYGPGVRASVPDALLEAAAAAREEQRTRRAIGSHNVLRFDSGYGSPESEGLWRREENAPTRLGEPTATIRLARCQSDGDLVPWASGDHPWRRSQLRVRAALVGQEAVRDGRQRRAAEAAKATMPDRGRWSVLVALRKDESDSGSPTGEGAPEEGVVWTGRARRADGTPVRVTYSATRGLSAAPLQS
jgi:CRISPR-associated endonuclease/helicase Cas3